ncbi:MAG: DUF2147 domain-containing protein [Bradyrhizobium sp.]|nr:DUF2147 domain-containing protein [Bradyrhizobium sp.]
MLHRPRKIIRKITCSGMFLATAFMTGFSTSFSPAFAADPTGDWRVQDGVADIRVAECNGSMWGVVVWEKTPGGHDKNNPDVSKQDRPTLGMPILLDMKKTSGVDQWEGEVYNAKDGQTYSSKIKPVGGDKLEIEGCVLGFLCGGETWTRVAGPIPSSPGNSMAKGAAKAAGAPPRTAAATPKAGTARTVGQNHAAAGANHAPAGSTDTVGDICLIPDIARFAH